MKIFEYQMEGKNDGFGGLMWELADRNEYLVFKKGFKLGRPANFNKL